MTDPANTVFVTGGNGFIGSRVVQQLHHNDAQVVCLLRATSDSSRIRNVPHTAVEGDVLDPASLFRGMSGSTECIHLASVSAWHKMDGDELESVVVDGSRNVLQAALECRLRRVVLVSSILAVNGSSEPRVFTESCTYQLTDPAMRYAHAKRAVEDLAGDFIKAGLEVVVVNPVETYGVDDIDLVTACNLVDFINNWPCLVTRGGTAIASVDDIAAGILAALSRGRSGHRYILGGDNLSIRELAELTLEIAGCRKPVVSIPPGLLRRVIPILVRLKLPSPVIPDLVPYLGYYFYADCTKARQELGYTPRGAREVLTPVVSWLRESGHVHG